MRSWGNSLPRNRQSILWSVWSVGGNFQRLLYIQYIGFSHKSFSWKTLHIIHTLHRYNKSNSLQTVSCGGWNMFDHLSCGRLESNQHRHPCCGACGALEPISREVYITIYICFPQSLFHQLPSNHPHPPPETKKERFPMEKPRHKSALEPILKLILQLKGQRFLPDAAFQRFVPDPEEEENDGRYHEDVGIRGYRPFRSPQ